MSTKASKTVKILGSEGAFSDNTTSYLIDGTVLVDVSDSIAKQLISTTEANDITHILITHKHMDHIGGIETLLYYRMVLKGFQEEIGIKLYMNTDTYDLFRRMAVYEHIHLIDRIVIIKEDDYGGYGEFNIKDMTVRVYDTIHMNGRIENTSYQFTNQSTDKSVFITGDVDEPYVVDPTLYEYIFHDVGWSGIPIPEDTTTKVHPTEDEVIEAYAKEHGLFGNVIGIHTSSKLLGLRQAHKDDVYHF